MLNKINLLSITIPLLFMFLFSIQNARAVINYTLEWNYTYNSSTFNEEANDVAVDSQRNIIVVGYNSSTTSETSWNITKLYENGTYMWNYTFESGISGSDDRAVSVAVDPLDDSFVVAGYNRNTSSTRDYEWRIMKFDSTNNKQWEVVYNITLLIDQPTRVAIDHESNIIVVGFYRASSITTTDYGWFILKLNNNGGQIWNKTFNFSNYDDRPSSVAVDNDNNITVVGYDMALGNNHRQWKIVKLDKNNNTLWMYNESFSPYNDRIYDVAVDNNNNIIAVGVEWSQGQYNSQWRVMKFKPDKNETLWNYPKDISTTADAAFGVSIDSFNNITVVGYFNASYTANDPDWLIIRLGGSDNAPLWNYTTHLSDWGDQPRSVAIDNKDDIVVVGSDSPSEGNLQWRVMKFKSIRCGNGRVESPYEDCDISDWGTCQAWEDCDTSTCQCYSLLPQTGGCTFFDNCASDPCTWWTLGGGGNCYVENADNDYKNLLLTDPTLCSDPFVSPHSSRTNCGV